ncbi:hypothetical protein FHT91_002227 [Rhizobium sp. BK347]|nr:hypothetical protein [Rhizobium sp. BK252]MBB3401995.1 hypothetical protein [Rhizobium sp. BK289]MBB3414572.1 hypothetical protein [Rhizobium sp. BK284]MBB3482461.1 hypothetical protein [Rhizobium sp. BK347]
MAAITRQGFCRMGTNGNARPPVSLSTGKGGNGEIEMDCVAYYVSNVWKTATKGG